MFMPPQDPEQKRQRIDLDLNSLPVLSPAAVKLFALDVDSEEYPARLSELLELEPSLAARVLRVSNSALSSPLQPVRSIPEAVMRMGSRRAGQLVKSIALLKVFTPRTEGELNLWRHAVQVAVAARAIAGASGRNLDPDVAYLAGLLHDIGRFVMFEHVPQPVRELEVKGPESLKDLLEIERTSCGYDHCELGWKACQMLAIPRDVTLIIRYHHSLIRSAGEFSAAQVTLLRTVQQADRLSCLVLGEREMVSLPPSKRMAKLDHACVSSEWDWAPVQGDSLDMLLDPIISRSDELVLALGVGEGCQEAPP